MLKALHALALCLITGGLFAQITVTANYLPEVGDSLKFASANPESVHTVTLHSAGGPYVWDLNGLTEAYASTQVFEALVPGTQDDAFPNANVKLPTGPLSTNYYNISDNGMVLVGNVGASDFLPGFDVTTPFSPGYVERRAPVNFIDNNTLTSNINVALPTDSLPQAIIDAAGTLLNAADSIRLRTEINRTDLVDAYGTVEIGNEVFDVLRERRQETRDVTIEAYNAFLGWQDITPLIGAAIPQLADVINNQDTLISYILWSDDSVDPIAVFSTENNGTTITEILYKDIQTTSSTNDDFISRTEIKMYPNPARTISTFEATGLQSGIYELNIHSIIGRKMISQTHNVIGSQLRSVVDVSQLPSGLYLFSLTNSRGRILATKRLFVGGR